MKLSVSKDEFTWWSVFRWKAENEDQAKQSGCRKFMAISLLWWEFEFEWRVK